ncbi:Biotin/lipoate A/B protein ligase [Cadophora gregata]|uniref:Biotin/lipoate A/B protein ligase n=1 Tax=Cadophora gregata TaxID=51156 RepID=UPI0026DAD9D2|nr:Biotin/lipoate A/B protein ligase [Cadophora gregata]KAK0106776.1 Biotin/lipoate A/B protein ligase [Cadophora gregata]
MAPSRGLNCLRQARLHLQKPRQDVRRFSDFVSAVADPSNKYQVYTSRSPNPYLNLSIEHYLLQKSPADATILFLYTNRPSVIIGRNQNPWTEVNLGLLRNEQGILQNADHRVQLVRRRSGGGTVFHDEGNVNYSVIMPTADFDRDKHAEMVARALRNLGVDKVRVNERHDIVVDKTVPGEGELPFKISGSAYKLTRLRSVHHGTCLLSSPNIGSISKYLRAPGKPFIKAKGVESVSSRIMNVGMENAKFEGAVRHEFWKMYSHSKAMTVGRAEADVPEIKGGFEELMSEDWIYGQTPQFEFSTSGFDGENLGEKDIWRFPHGLELSFTARNATIQSLSIKDGENFMVTSSAKDKKVHEIADWDSVLAAPFKKSYVGKSRHKVQAQLAKSMNELFGAGSYDTGVGKGSLSTEEDNYLGIEPDRIVEVEGLE